MASICKIDGKWRALIRKKGHDPISKWFDTKGKAQVWADAIEAKLKAGATHSGIETVSDAIRKYRKLRSTQRPIRDDSSEHYTLKMLDTELGSIHLDQLSVDSVIDFAHRRRAERAGPYTVLCDLSKFGTVLRYTHPAALEILGNARPKLSYLGLIGGGGLRERRPTEEELTLLLQSLEEKRGLKYRDFVEAAAITALRRGELSNLRWADLDIDKRMVLVRDRKDPRKKAGNDQLVPLLGKSFEIFLRQDKSSELIFNVNERTMSKYFKEACDTLGIVDLHFHDLRHEGISRMFEDGLEIQHVSLVSGHRSWQHLKRYTNLNPEKLHKVHQDKLQQRGHQTTASHHQDKTEP